MTVEHLKRQRKRGKYDDDSGCIYELLLAGSCSFRFPNRGEPLRIRGPGPRDDHVIQRGFMAFFGFRVWDIDTTVTGKPVWAATSQGLLPHGVSIVLIGIAGYCLLDAYRSSREAAVASAGTDSDDVESA